jgi:hypothetical protein
MADPTEAEDSEPESPKGLRAQLEAQVEENKHLKAQAEKAAQLERELALSKSGWSNLSDSKLVALNAVLDGDYSVENINAKATDLYGANGAGQSTPAPTDTDHSAEATELAALASSPAGDETGSSGPLTQEAIDEAIAKAMVDGGPEGVQAFMMANRDRFGF